MIPRTLFTAEHETFRDSVRRFLEAEVKPFDEKWQEQGYADKSVWKKAGENGLLAVNTTEAWFSAIESLVLSHASRTKYANSAINYVNKNYSIGVAAMAWEKLVLSLVAEGHITRRKIVYSQQHETPVRSKNSWRWLASMATSPTAYIKALKMIKNHGVSGLINRIKRK